MALHPPFGGEHVWTDAERDGLADALTILVALRPLIQQGTVALIRGMDYALVSNYGVERAEMLIQDVYEATLSRPSLEPVALKIAQRVRASRLSDNTLDVYLRSKREWEAARLLSKAGAPLPKHEQKGLVNFLQLPVPSLDLEPLDAQVIADLRSDSLAFDVWRSDLSEIISRYDQALDGETDAQSILNNVTREVTARSIDHLQRDLNRAAKARSREVKRSVRKMLVGGAIGWLFGPQTAAVSLLGGAADVALEIGEMSPANSASRAALTHYLLFRRAAAVD